MFSFHLCLRKVKTKCLCSPFVRLRSDIITLQRGHSTLKCVYQYHKDLDQDLYQSTYKQKHTLPGRNAASRNRLMQSTPYHLALSFGHWRCLYLSVKSHSLLCPSLKHCDVKKTFKITTCFSWTNHNSRQLRGYSSSRKETVNIQQLLDHALKNAELPGIMVEPSHSRNKHKKRDRIKRKFDHNDAENVEEKPPTVEKKLLSLMKMWKMDEAVDLLVETLKTGFTPHSGVILNLLQQLANLGEVDNILELHDEFLEGKSITREVKFYALLTEAYCNSGRVEEGVDMLRIIYHKTRNFDDTDAFFSMITIMVIKNFEHHLYLITDFVNDLMESDPPVDKALASLWKCLVLTERFDQANDLVEEYENLVKFIPAQVSEIVNAPFYITYNKDTVLSWLTQMPHIKTPLKAAVFESLIEKKCEDKKWQEALECLREAMTSDEALVKQSTLTLFFSSFLNQLSDDQVRELEDLATCLERQNISENESDKHDDKDS